MQVEHGSWDIAPIINKASIEGCTSVSRDPFPAYIQRNRYMKHLDLFSGIGGFAYAVDQVYENATHTFCDNDPFCQAVLAKHWPDSQVYGDIKEVTLERALANAAGERFFRSRAKQKSTLSRLEATADPTYTEFKIDLLTGGFPCQPFSQAGRRKGTADDRYLWPPMLECISLFKPRWVIAENVAGLVTWNNGLVLEQVCADLESEGYEVQAFIIPAVSVNAPHRRDRVWIVAHNKKLLSNEGVYSTRSGQRKSGRKNWNANWLEIATRLCRVDDGLPRRMDRNPRLKALGNAIVPQVAIEIMKAIKANQ